MLQNITPVVLTYNESPNIARTLDALNWAKKIFVVDSFSTDDTVNICANYPNVSLIQRKFDQHATQWNFAIDQAKNADWILALDADHVVSPALTEELSILQPEQEIDAYQVHYQYLINGKPLRKSLYPPLFALYRQGSGRYLQDGHTQRMHIKSGKTSSLNSFIQHDDRKSYQHWLNAQHKYARLEVKKLQQTPFSQLSINDKIRRLPFIAPMLVAPYLLIFKGLLLDGMTGITYVKQRLIAENILQYHLFIKTRD